MEIWKDIEGYEGFYQVSNTGKVKSISRLKHTPNKTTYLCKEKLMKLHKDKTYGYIQLELCKNNTGTTVKVHRLVAIAFVPNPLNLPQVNHLDGDKTNNNDWNLGWTDNSGNQIHAFKLGLNKQKKGENHIRSKLTNLQATDIRLKYKNNISIKILAEEFNVNKITIRRIIKNILYNE